MVSEAEHERVVCFLEQLKESAFPELAGCY